MHSKPVTAIDERVAPDEFWCKWFVVVRFMGEVQLGYTSFRDDAAIIRLSCVLVEGCWLVVSLVIGVVLTFMTSSSLLSFLGRILPFRFAMPLLGFMFASANMVAVW